MVFSAFFSAINSGGVETFQGGDIDENDLESAMALISTSSTVDVVSGVNGTITLGGNLYGGYNYSVWNGGSYTLTTGNVAGSFINNNPDRHAFVCFKGNTTLDLNNITTVRKITTVIYCDGNLTLTNGFRVKGCNQANSNLYTTNPSSFPLTLSYNMTGKTGNGGGGGGGAPSGTGGIFSSGAGGAGGGSCGTSSTWGGGSYGGAGGRNTTGGFAGYWCGGGAGNPGGTAFIPNTQQGTANNGASATGGTLILIVNGTLTQSSGTISVKGFGGGSANHYSGVQASGGGGSGGGRIFAKRISGNLTNTDVTGGSGGSGNSSGSSGASGSLNYFT